MSPPGVTERETLLRRRAVHSASNADVREVVRFVFAPTTGYLIILGATVVGAGTAGPHDLDFNRGGPEGPLVPRHLAVLSGIYPPAWVRTALGR